MQVHELAKEIGVENKAVQVFLNKSSHLSSVTDEEANRARVAAKTGAFSSPDAKKIKFWSRNRDQRIARMDGTSIRFRNYIFVCDEGSNDCKTIRSVPHPDVMEVVDAPYKDEAEAARFRKELSSLVFTGSMREISRDRGMTALTSLFWMNELDDLKDKMWNPDALIERAVRIKSLRK